MNITAQTTEITNVIWQSQDGFWNRGFYTINHETNQRDLSSFSRVDELIHGLLQVRSFFITPTSELVMDDTERAQRLDVMRDACLKDQFNTTLVTAFRATVGLDEAYRNNPMRCNLARKIARDDMAMYKVPEEMQRAFFDGIQTRKNGGKISPMLDAKNAIVEYAFPTNKD